LTYLITFIGSEKVAFDIKNVVRVLPMLNITPLEGTPSYILGIINFKGEVIPLLNLPALFGSNDLKINMQSKIVILQLSERKIGIIADEVQTLIIEDNNKIKATEIWGKTNNLDSVLKLTDGELILIRDVENFLTEADSKFVSDNLKNIN